MEKITPQPCREAGPGARHPLSRTDFPTSSERLTWSVRGMCLAACCVQSMSSHVAAPTRDGPAPVRTDLRSLDKVRGIFASLAKFVGAQAIYQSNNPNLVKFARAFEESFRSYF